MAKKLSFREKAKKDLLNDWQISFYPSSPKPKRVLLNRITKKEAQKRAKIKNKKQTLFSIDSSGYHKIEKMGNTNW